MGQLSRRTFAAASGLALLPAGLSSRAFAQGAALKVGVLLPRSGIQAKIGEACQQGADVAVPILKEMGFPALEMIKGDTESNPQTSRTAAEKLIEAGAQLVIGAFDSGQTIAAAQVCEQKGIPLVVNIAAAPQITETGYKFVVRNFPTGGRIVADALALQKQLFQSGGATPKTAVLMHVNDTFGESVKGGINALFPKAEMPYTLVDQIAYDPRARDLSVEVAKAKASGAELLWMVSRLNDAILVTRELIKQRWEPMGIISSGPGYYEDQYLKTLEKNADFVFNTVPWYDPKKPLAQKLIAAMSKTYPGAQLDTNQTFTFEAMLVAADAYKRAGSAKPDALREALGKTNIKDNAAVSNGIAFNEKGHNDGVGCAGVQAQKGALKVVLPANAQEAKPVWPAPGWSKRT
jgi:branched-chain amino acid transport system substrate-binding protein